MDEKASRNVSKGTSPSRNFSAMAWKTQSPMTTDVCLDRGLLLTPKSEFHCSNLGPPYTTPPSLAPILNSLWPFGLTSHTCTCLFILSPSLEHHL
jgi:hypothetical protein